MTKDAGLSILVVGGGPVGLYTALELASCGHQITVIEQGYWPRDKVCGEGIMPIGVKLLKEAGVFEFIEKSQSSPFTGVQYFDGELTCGGKFKNSLGLGVRRLALSRALYEKALQNSNITLMDASQLISLEFHKDKVEAKLRGQSYLWQGDFVVGADGIHSKVRKAVGTRVEKLSRHARLGARVHLEIPTSEQVSSVQIFWGDSIEAYLTPSGEGSLEIAFLWDQSKTKVKSSELEDWLWSQFPTLSKRLRHLSRLSEFSVQGGFGQRSSKIAGERWALVGDASYFFDGITGEGLSLGFAMGRCLAHALSKGGLREFKRSSNRLIRHNIYLTRLALFMGRHSWLRAVAMRVLAKGLMGPILTKASQISVPQRPTGRAFQISSKWA